MHGARNDFIVLDRRNAGVDDLKTFSRRACDRRAGIGADGLIVLDRSSSADVRMRIFNADGSEAEMCGNGIRCAARWLDEAGEGGSVRFETLAGTVQTEVVSRGSEYQVRVAMGTPRIVQHDAPLFEDARFVDVGNPHVVIFRKGIDDIDLTMVATRLQSAKQFAHGTNVHVAVVEAADRLRVKHWERGVGLTMACGTGAVACVAAGLDMKSIRSPVEVFVPGGRLVVEWDGAGPAYLTGPAARVFDTEVGVEAEVAS